MDPISTGDYPFTMRAIAGDRVPKFTPQQSKLLKGSYDFLGLNYYTTQYARSISLLTKVNVTFDDDVHAFTTGNYQTIVEKMLGMLVIGVAVTRFMAQYN